MNFVPYLVGKSCLPQQDMFVSDIFTYMQRKFLNLFAVNEPMHHAKPTLSYLQLM